MQVEVAVPVDVGHLVDRHPFERNGDVGPVDRVESTQEILVGLAVAAVGGGVEAGHRAQEVVCGAPGHRLDRRPVKRAIGRRALRAFCLDDDHFGGRIIGGRVHGAL